MFINFSNHPSSKWDENQKKAASVYGEIKDVPFPSVSASADENEIALLAYQCVEEILGTSDHIEAVMVQGEFTLTYAVVNRLRKAGIRTVSACAERNVVEKKDASGNEVKESIFQFVRFREYRI